MLSVSDQSTVGNVIAVYMNYVVCQSLELPIRDHYHSLYKTKAFYLGWVSTTVVCMVDIYERRKA